MCADVAPQSAKPVSSPVAAAGLSNLGRCEWTIIVADVCRVCDSTLGARPVGCCVGNTCYMNSLLQCLLANTDFMGAVKSLVDAGQVAPDSTTAALARLQTEPYAVNAFVSRLEKAENINLRQQSDSGQLLQTFLLPRMYKESQSRVLFDLIRLGMAVRSSCQVRTLRCKGVPPSIIRSFLSVFVFVVVSSQL